MTLESKLRALVAEWRGATKAISADGASRPLEWEGKDILRLCADRIEALLAESERPTVHGASPICLDCHKAGIRNCSHFDECDGTWVYKSAAQPSSGTESGSK